MPSWLWMVLVVVVLVIVAGYVQEGLIRLMFYVLALVLAVATVLRMTGTF
jgi:hypothetical protein